MPEYCAVEQASTSDGAAVTALLQASYPVLMDQAYAAATLAQFLPVITKSNPVLLASGRFYVARKDDAVVGCGGWSDERPGSQERIQGLGHIRHFAVHPQCVRQGIGRAIMNRCELEARATGVELLVCYSSLNAEQFYASLGFDRIAPLEVAIGPIIRMPAVHMEKRLSR
jgi:GNAT superfamily N-acetyltransferase